MAVNTLRHSFCEYRHSYFPCKPLYKAIQYKMKHLLYPNQTVRTAAFIGIFFLIKLNGYTQSIDYGKSYVNVSKGVNGGTIEPGDMLEIRATFVVKSGTVTQCSFTDNIPANTAYIPGTIRILTDEGVIFKQLTDASDADGGTFSPPAIIINIGAGANATTGGTVSSSSNPSLYNNACIMIATYRVLVTGPYGTRLQLGQGVLQYMDAGSVLVPVTFPYDSAIVRPNNTLCNNVVGANAFVSESGGTFGTGNIKDRSASTRVPSTYTYVPFSSTTGMPDDYFYGVSNNTSGGATPATGYSASDAWPVPDHSSPSHRIFGSWDIIGDHTGASNPLLGNPPADVNAGQTGGYMLVINSSYRTNITFVDTVNNLCPNTQYTYSAWIRNICRKCGCDSNGTSWDAPGYIPQAPGDSSGIRPNLTFSVNGLDYYTTGEIPYTGQWVQKGLTYHTRANQTSMIVTIRNNAPGGGGNDWAIDDISVATCTPDMALQPNTIDTLCQGTVDTVSFVISSDFRIYNYWKLEKSIDGGATWISPGNDIASLRDTGVGTPVLNAATHQFEYTVTRNYGLNITDTAIRYRISVTADSANFATASACTFTGSAIKIVRSPGCLVLLPAGILSFNGHVAGGLAKLQWNTTHETGGETYIIERSDDGAHFQAAGSVKAAAGQGSDASYSFTDTRPLAAQALYRIKMENGNYYKYSRQLMLSATTDFGIRLLENPFTSQLSLSLAAPADGTAVTSLVDMYGKRLRIERQSLKQGFTTIRLGSLGALPAGIYVLQVQYGNKLVSEKIIKMR